MTLGLAVSDVVNVEVELTPLAVPVRNFGVLLILGASSVIDTNERVRQYATLSEVTDDFGTTLPEYKAASAFFSQNPQPAILYLGRWAQNGSAGILYGGTFNATAQAALLSALNAITTGSMIISVDGTPHTLTTLNFSAAVSLPGAAAIINTALPSATVTWDNVNGRFKIVSNSLGSASTVSYATAGGGGTDVTVPLKLTAATGASVPVAGIAAETPVQVAATLASMRNDWYGLAFAPANPGDITSLQYQAVAALIEGLSPGRIFGYTSMDSAALDPTSTTDLPAVLASLRYRRTVGQYSSTNPYAICSLYGRAFTVDFAGNNTVITIDFKQEPGIVAETITETAYRSLLSKNCNVFVNFSNSTAIITAGVMQDGTFFDVVHTTDWYANALQTAFFNALYTTPTKIPQTDSGIGILVAVAELVGDQAVRNGMLAPGVWNGPPLGSIVTGQALIKGYYTFVPPIALQAQSDRERRVAPTIQQALKLAGAVQTVDAIVTINQ